MKTVVTAFAGACMALAVSGAMAQDPKKDAMSKDMKPMTMQECKDHMAMSTKAGTKKDDAMMKKDAMCEEMMKKEAAAPKK